MIFKILLRINLNKLQKYYTNADVIYTIILIELSFWSQNNDLF